MSRLVGYWFFPAMRFLLVSTLLSFGLVTGQELVEPIPSEPVRPITESESRQFVIHGNELKVRSRLASMAEKVKDALVEQAGRGPVDPETGNTGWQHTVVVELHGNPGDEEPSKLIVPGCYFLDDGFRLQLDLHLARGINREVLERELLQLLIYERGLRDQDPNEVPERISVPAWLVDGLLESIRWGRQEVDRDLYRALFEKNVVFPIDQLLKEDGVEDMDGATRVAYRVSSGALVLSLIHI